MSYVMAGTNLPENLGEVPGTRVSNRMMVFLEPVAFRRRRLIVRDDGYGQSLLRLAPTSDLRSIAGTQLGSTRKREARDAL